MKTLRLSDEDYQALLYCLEQAANDALYADPYNGGDGSLQEREANRLYDLLKPMEYQDGEA